jgi:hypothetical protein
MRTRWEYLVVEWRYSTNFASVTSSEPQTWESVYYVARAGADTETHPGDLDWIAFVNDLGEQGWEMVSETTRLSVIVAQAQGWKDVGRPISIVWQFKRPVE